MIVEIVTSAIGAATVGVLIYSQIVTHQRWKLDRKDEQGRWQRAREDEDKRTAQARSDELERWSRSEQQHASEIKEERQAWTKAQEAIHERRGNENKRLHREEAERARRWLTDKMTTSSLSD